MESSIVKTPEEFVRKVRRTGWESILISFDVASFLTMIPIEEVADIVRA